VFKQGATTIGTLAFSEVKPNQEITITVAVNAGSVTLMEQKRNGIGHGDLEIEGLVQQVLTLSTSGDSRFLIDGRTVVARPGQTAIREGNVARTVNDVTVGRQVHVKGTWLPPRAAPSPCSPPRSSCRTLTTPRRSRAWPARRPRSRGRSPPRRARS